MKYKLGEFGYWWTIEEGNIDIEGKIYNGNINCVSQDLTSLKGCPKTVNGVFDCSSNQLNSLEFCPEIVNGYFDCRSNKFISLEHCPKIVNSVFWCNINNIKNIDEFKHIKYAKNIITNFNDFEVRELVKNANPEMYC